MVCVLQASGQKAYAIKEEELPERLAAYKHARARWQGTDNGAYGDWVENAFFPALTPQEVNTA